MTMQAVSSAPEAALPAALDLGPVVLRSRDPDHLVPFYEQVVGLAVLRREPEGIVLGAGDRALVELRRDPAARPAPERAPGLFHLAVRVPDRASLARRLWAIQHAGLRYGASDHLVSEALYVDDPDGNGVEIYRDRPRDQWPWDGDRIAMATLPLDVTALAAAGAPAPSPAPVGTDMGHVHLKVGDLGEAERFWVGLMGLSIMATYPGALFVAAGGYHHHLGLNVWRSRGAPALEAGHAGLDHITLRLPASEVARLEARLGAADYPFTRTANGLRVADPSGNGVEITAL